MKYGCCVNTLPRQEGSVGAEYIPALRELGYDYVELPLNGVTQLDEGRFEALLELLARTGLPCRCCNDFMPSSFQIVGEQTTPEQVLTDYLDRAMERLSRLGAPYTVFGSPWSRSRPQDFPQERALEQIAGFLRLAGERAGQHGVTIAIENNNRGETNMLNHFSDAAAMARRVDHPNVKVLCDYYHLRFEGDTPQVLDGGADLLVHTHIAQLENRRYLTDLSKEPMLPEYARALHAIGYQGGVSIEGKVDSPQSWREDARLTLENLRRVFD